MIPRQKHFSYWSHMGDLFEVLKKNLPADIYDKFYSLYLIYNVEDMFKFADFQLFRAKYQDVEVTFQQYVNMTYSVKVNYL